MAFFFNETTEDHILSSAQRLGAGTCWTTQCTGDIGLAVNGRVITQAFLHGEPLNWTLHIYDIIAGGEPQVLPLSEGLNLMTQRARAYAKEQAQCQ